MGDTRIKESAFQRKVIKFLKEHGKLKNIHK